MPTSTRLGTALLDSDDETHNSDLHLVWGNGHTGSPSDIPQSHSFSSAVRRNDTTPSKRRHGSDAAARRARTDHDRWQTDGASSTHVRARTLDDDEARTGLGRRIRKNASQHPLRAPSVASSSSVTLEHDTRPSMRRMLSLDDASVGMADAETNAGHERSFSQDRQMLVIVHRVQPTDSLAGVALKYGISLAELRKSNQLWPSDPIHLRDTLYIPVDKARHVRHLRHTLAEGPSGSTHLDSPPSGPGPPDGTEQIDAAPTGTGEKYTLRRVPASQLSFFPPPSNPSPPRSGGLTPGSSQTLPSRRPPTSTGARPPLPHGFSRGRPPNQDVPLQSVFDIFSSTAHHLRTAYAQSQSSLFSALPIKPAASLASRLSLDSTSATASSASEDIDWEHEMDDIRPSPLASTTTTSPNGNGNAGQTRRRRDSQRTREQLAASRRSGPTTTPSGRAPESVELDTAPFTAPDAKHRRSSSSRSHSSHIANGGANGHEKRAVPYAVADATPAEWEAPPAAPLVRTAQLEPSPGMQLPVLHRRRPRVEEA